MAAACGDSETAGDDAELALTRVEFVKKGDEICGMRLKEKDRLVGQALSRYVKSAGENGKAPVGASEELIQAALVPLEGVARELDELPLDGRERAAADEIVAKLEAGMKTAKTDPRRFALGHPLAAAAAVAKTHGLEDCRF
jgi:hypothetical protein